MEHPWGKEIQGCSIEVPRVMYGPHPRGLNFYIVIYRGMLKKIFFSRTTRPISTKHGRKHAWGMGIQICSNKGSGPLRGNIRKILINLEKSSSHEPPIGMH